MRAIGVTFATGMLFSERGIIARECDVHRALREYDPTSYAKRVKEASKTQYVYNVSTGQPHRTARARRCGSGCGTNDDCGTEDFCGAEDEILKI